MKTKVKKAPALPLFSTLLAELSAAFVSDKRADGTTFYKLSDRAASWVTSDLMHRVYTAIDDRLPDDWVYEHAARIAEAFGNYSAESAEDLREHVGEIADSLVDVYNSELTKWLASNLANIALCDEAVEEMGVGTAGGIIGAMQAGQYHALECIASTLLYELESELERREGGAL